MPPKRKAATAPNATSARNYTGFAGDRTKKPSPAWKPVTDYFKKEVPPELLTAQNAGHDRPHKEVEAKAERNGIVDRRFYPAEMSNERCAQYNTNKIPRPMELLTKALDETAAARKAIRDGRQGDAVIHWFKRDLRIRDNTGLSKASVLAKELAKGVIGVWIMSPQDWEAHLSSPAKCDFELRSVEMLRNELAELNIPLHIEVIEKRRNVPKRLVEMAREWGVKNVFCNLEYEPDELRREEKLVRLMLEEGINFEPQHDDCVVPPGTLKTGGGKQFSLFTPWYRSWVNHLNTHPHLLDERPMPDQNPPGFRKSYEQLFDAKVPKAPESKMLPDEDKQRLHPMYPAGEAAALDRLERFLKEKVGKYKDMRNFTSKNYTARISLHHTTGTLAARTSVRLARDINTSTKVDGGNPGISKWISALGWRDFFRHVLCHWPYICMNKSFKPECTNIAWEYSDPNFEAWKAGRTGYPVVDAAMRCMNNSAYMHNRVRMVVASFLAKDLLLDWRLGEQYFMLKLIDGDFSINHGGWGFASSTGVNPQPYYHVFNPLLQSEKFDEDGDFIRAWVPELREIEGKEIHNPYAKSGTKAAAIAAKNGYPRPIVEHKFGKERYVARYKASVERGTA